jgi:hypothetical protein
MSQLKAKGTLKADMRSWSLAEVQNRHRKLVDSYTTKLTEKIKCAIQAGEELSKYVTEIEDEEHKHLSNMEIVSSEDNVNNPFHGVLQSSKASLRIYAYKQHEVMLFGLKLKEITGVEGVVVDYIDKDSIFADTILHVGMTITEVMGVPINSAKHFVDAIGEHTGWFHCVASTVPSVGKLFIIRRKNDKKGEHKVFIPDKNSTGTYNHAQSDFHIHTGYFMRCRYIQRALMDHPDYSMKDIATIHWAQVSR